MFSEILRWKKETKKLICKIFSLINFMFEYIDYKNLHL